MQGNLTSKAADYMKPEAGPWGTAKDLEHWAVLMFEWGKTVKSAIEKLEKKPSGNPDDPPQPPWGIG